MKEEDKSGKRVVLLVIDSLGVGCLPDASEYGDEDSDTFANIVGKCGILKIPNLIELGLTSITGIKCMEKNPDPKGAFAKAMERSVGKDTITGHWEIAGICTETPFKTFTDTGFPEEFIKAFEEKIKIKVIGNYSASGTEIIKELGPLHEKTGKPIVYTSADSVFQIAANVEVIPVERLYEMCDIARDLLQGEWLVGRVIARPYIHKGDEYIRTSDRKDFSVSPPEPTVLDMISGEGNAVYAVGKIYDIFNGQGITHMVHTNSNADGVTKTIQALSEVERGLIFTNLVDFDAKFGHRRDPEGYGHALEAFDERIPEIIDSMNEQDLLIMCADHGNDPTFKGWNHTREYIPVIAYSKKFTEGVDMGILDTFADIGATISDYLGTPMPKIGKSFLGKFKWG
jgi:phosphopentomutase